MLGWYPFQWVCKRFESTPSVEVEARVFDPGPKVGIDEFIGPLVRVLVNLIWFE